MVKESVVCVYLLVTISFTRCTNVVNRIEELPSSTKFPTIELYKAHKLGYLSIGVHKRFTMQADSLYTSSAVPSTRVIDTYVKKTAIL